MEFSILIFYIITFLTFNTLFVNTLPINVNNSNNDLSPDILNSKSIEFNFTLPNHQILKVNISFLMLKESIQLETRDEDSLNTRIIDYIDDDENIIETTTTTTTTSTTSSTPTISTDSPALQYFTVDDAIEAFRKDLIKQEINIGGILESNQPFYRHFNLKYENVDIPIRCTYDNVFDKHKLKISCFEYREFEQERILSNGEIEKVRIPDLSAKLHNIQIVNLKNYTQTYKMDIE